MRDEHGVKRLWLPGQDEPDVAGELNSPDILLEDVTVSEITDTTLADTHADKSSFTKELEAGTEDLGGGFLMKEEPVIVDRDVRTGRITRLTPLNEIPGVEYHDGRINFEAEPVVTEEKETKYPVDRETRRKIVEILASRLMKHYSKLPEDYPGYNPLRDGIPEIPAGSPEFLEPLPGTPLYPATRAQVFEYLKREAGKRASFINKRRFGTDGQPDLRDLDIRIQ